MKFTALGIVILVALFFATATNAFTNPEGKFFFDKFVTNSVTIVP